MRKLLLSITVFLTYSCWPPGMDPDKKDGKFLSDVVNLDEFNSEYDDYNSTMPSNRSGDAYLAFSSKRAKKNVFNLVYFPAHFSYDKKLSLKKGKDSAQEHQFVIYDNAESLILKANGNFNVFGPRLVSLRDDFINFATADDLLLFYADDAAGDLDIKYVKRGNHDPELFSILNSTANDAYPTFSWTGDRIYFCSDRDGDFDIYELTIPRTETEQITVESLVHPPKYTLRKVEELSTPYDDKCPYVYHDTMVFVSDRPGGNGGQDIYYSTYENGKWSIPVNPGDRVNTSYDEYRPILPNLSNFNYDLMFFSSNRPGGKGGFDLYMTGLKRKY